MPPTPYLYIIGSLRNPQVPTVALELRQRLGCDVFADWHGAGPHADDEWRRYEQEMGYDYLESLYRPAARMIFDFDRHHLEAATHTVLVMPAGKSGFMELGWGLGRGKPGYILLEPETDRWDVMFQFATGVARSVQAVADMIRLQIANRGQ